MIDLIRLTDPIEVSSKDFTTLFYGMYSILRLLIIINIINSIEKWIRVSTNSLFIIKIWQKGYCPLPFFVINWFID